MQMSAAWRFKMREAISESDLAYMRRSYIDHSHQGGANKETRVKRRMRETLSNYMIGKVVEGILGQLAEAIYQLLEFEHKVPIMMEAIRLTDIDVFIRTKWGMDKGSSDVGLGRNQVHAC